jgi:ABC-type proline/glycine betaine transport system ATPase subunit
MDEPLASLDAITREKLQDMLRTLMHTRTCLFVTHDLTEAFRIAERICVMDGGKVSVYYDRSAFADPDRRNIIRQHIVSHLNNKENSFL